MLNIHSAYSLRYGILEPPKLLESLQKSGYTTAALTDINNTTACLEFVRLAPGYGIRPVTGIDFRNGAQQCFVGLARNNKGFRNLNDYLAFHLCGQLPLPRRAIPMPDTCIIYPFRLFSVPEPLEENEYIGIQISDLTKLRVSSWMKYPEKLVILQSFSFRNRRDFNTHRLLRAIDNNTLLSKLPKSEEGSEQDLLMDKTVLYEHFREFPFLIRNSETLLESCTIEFQFGPDQETKNLHTYTGSVSEDRELIRKLCREGLPYRYPRAGEEVYARVNKELEIIESKGFLSYYLINWDLVRYAQNKGYFHVGRGSGANSVVAYLLGITDVNPIELDLYFERFINLYRQNPPDFDIDFSWTDRDDITRYLFNRYPHVSLMGTVNTFQERSVVRELGKVFGLPPQEIDSLSLHRRPENDLSALVLRYAGHIKNLPSQLSVHSCGILISQESIHHFGATFLPPKGFPTTQFDMRDAERVGLYKFDILAQRGLGKIKDTLRIIRENQPDAPLIDLHDTERFKQDEKVKTLLREGKAIGCFYVESPGMRMLLTKLRVDDYLGLVAASSIIRPGVSQSGMMREYILRHRIPERRQTAHPVLLDIMPETYGVMVYQEDVIKVAHHFAGLSLAESDVLRRSMSGKHHKLDELNEVEKKFFTNCLERGYSSGLIREIWRQIVSFAGFAFAKGHSASYAVESYQCLFLKAYYPLEYLLSVINNSGGFYSLETYVHEARMEGAVIHPPCINIGEDEAVIRGRDIYLGFRHIVGLDREIALRIPEERQSGGNFVGLDDFLERIPECGLGQLSILIRIGAFRSCGGGKRELLWQAHLKVNKAKPVPGTLSLFRIPRKQFRLPALYCDPLEQAFEQIELLGFPLCSPFELLRENPRNSLRAADLGGLVGSGVTICGYLVHIKHTQTAGGQRMNFGTFLDRDGYFFDTVHFPEAAARFPFRGQGVYSISGRVTAEFEFCCIEVDELHKLALVEDPRYSESSLKTLHNEKAGIN